MYRITNDTELFKLFWSDERQNSPRYFNDSGSTWVCTETDFQGFCQRMWRVYNVDDRALVYIEPSGEVHLSVLRGADTSNLVTDLIEMRNEVLQEKPLLFGWVGAKNRGIRKLMKSIGFKFQGFSMWYGESHSKVLQWDCFVATQKEYFVCKDSGKLLNSV